MVRPLLNRRRSLESGQAVHDQLMRGVQQCRGPSTRERASPTQQMTASPLPVQPVRTATAARLF